MFFFAGVRNLSQLMPFGFWEIYEKEGLENLPMQEKQLCKLLDSVVSISSSVLTNGRKRFFFTISLAPQIFRLFFFFSVSIES